MVVHRAMKKPKLSHAMESACRAVGLTSALGSPVILKLCRNEPVTSSTTARNTLAAAIKLALMTHWG
jgi:hypothetical protein